MRLRWSILVVAVVAMGLAGCGSDDPGGGDNENANSWDLDGDAGTADSGDADTAKDSGTDEDAGTEQDTDPGQDTGTDVGPPPDEVTEEMLLGDPWYTVWRLTDDPAVTGLYSGIEFMEDGEAMLHAVLEQPVNWEILGSGDVHVYNMPGDFEQMMLTPDLDDGQLFALEIDIPADDLNAYTARYEQRGDVDVEFEDIEGAWQSLETYPGEFGDYRLALRVTTGPSTVELGAVGQDGNFFGFVDGEGITQTYATGHTFWAMMTDPANEESHPVAGEIQGEGDDKRLFMLTEVEDDGPGPPGDSELVAVELESVDEFYFSDQEDESDDEDE